MASDTPVQPLQNVQVALLAESRPGAADLISPPLVFTWVHGVASSGLTPLEYALLGKKPGESVSVEVKTAALCEYFGHIDDALPQLLVVSSTLDTVHMQLEVVAVSAAADREVVAATARSLSHGGCGGSCGCGCS